MSEKFKKIAVLYKQFAESWTGLDFSDKALIDMFNSESFGTPVDQRLNGYYIGKQWMGVTIAMWKEDLDKGQLKLWELYDDPKLPHWWLDREFGKEFDSLKKKPTLEDMMKDIFG